LGYGDVAQPDLWLAFFGRAAHNELLAGPNEDLFSVYAHQDARLFDQPANKRVVSRPFWRHALIPPAWRVTTDYRNGTSLELARMALFRYALEDNPTNYKFVLLSESCIPLHPLSHMHSRLTRDPRPRVHEMPDVRPETRPEAPTDDTVRERMGPGAWPSTSRSSLKRGKRWVASMAPLITETRRGSLLQARQFVIAGRAEVERFPGADEIASMFGPMTRAEEHVFYNILVFKLGYRRFADIDVGCVTYQYFPPRAGSGYRVPLPCRTSPYRGFLELHKEHEIMRSRQIDRGGCLFARKFLPATACNLSCLAHSGFKHFRC